MNYSQNNYRLERAKPPIIQVLQNYGISAKMCGCRAKTCCIFHNEKSASLTIYIDQNRYYCFGCGASGDSYDLLAHLSGKPLSEVLRDHCFKPNLERRRDFDKHKILEQKRDDCYSRLVKIDRDLYRQECELGQKPSNDNLEMLANVYLIREIVWPLLDKLADDDNAIVQIGLSQAREQGLWRNG